VRYLGQRLLQLIGVLFIVSFLTFLLVRFLPGDPVLSVTGIPQSAADSGDPELIRQIEEAREDLNLDDSIPVDYVQWLGDLLPPDVDLGFSYVRNTEVSELIGTALPRTALLMVYSIILSLVIAIPLGVLAAYRAGGWVDRLISTTAFGVIAVPNFVAATVLVYIFAVQLGWFPASGVKTIADDGLVEHLKSYTLPVVSLSLSTTAVFARTLRTDMVATLQEDFIGMAKAKGMPVRSILLRHALRPSSFTLLTIAGLNVGQLIGGSVIIEVIFNINGLGSQIAAAVLRSDYVLVQSGVVLIAAAFITINFIVDLLYGVFDPRVRHARRH